MAMSWASLLYNCNLYYQLAYSDYISHDHYTDNARTHYYAEEYPEAIWDLIQGQYGLYDVVKRLCGYGLNWGAYSYLVPAMFEKLLPAEDITTDMAGMILAMYEAEPDEINSFIGLTEAFKMYLWNRPFYAENWAEIARGFEQ